MFLLFFLEGEGEGRVEYLFDIVPLEDWGRTLEAGSIGELGISGGSGEIGDGRRVGDELRLTKCFCLSFSVSFSFFSCDGHCLMDHISNATRH